MKYSIFLFYGILICLSCWWTAAAAFSKILVHKNDIIIADNSGSLKCDQILCPRNAYLCRVLKETDLNNPHVLWTINTCYSKDGTILFQSQKKTTSKNERHTYLDLVADRDGVVITNEQVKEGFHFSTKNIAALQNKLPGYIQGIVKNMQKTHEVIAKKLASLWNKKA